jgi:hypothetical protein
MASKKKGGYGKRPMWQWALIYLVIGAIVYFALYYFFFADKGYKYSRGSDSMMYEEKSMQEETMEKDDSMMIEDTSGSGY